MKKKDYFGIFNSWDCYDEDIIKETREMLAECNDIPVEKVSDQWVWEIISGCLDDEKCNLDIETGGYILAFATLGLWNGRPIAYKEIGTNVADIFNSWYGGDECEWYADKYNVRCKASHHDGTNCMVFRYVESKEEMERLCERIYNGEIKSEKKLWRVTKSIRPFVAETYGWKEYGKQAS